MATNTRAQEATAIVCIGMAGSGKTTFMQRINSYLHSKRTPPYVVNLDPAVRIVPFDCNIDIRESIDYKEVMKQYNLGPNGGILTSLNLFATKVDQVLGILERRCGVIPAEAQPQEGNAKPKEQENTGSDIKHILIDTPGQIEVFVWSASGQILLSSLASSFPTVLAYVIDTPRTASTSTFMSNMLYACSILYKTRLPMILVFNKTDVQSADFAKDWMTDFEAFQAALRREEETGVYGGSEGGVGGPAVGGSGYMSSLLNSMSLMLEEFYSHLSVVGVSAMTGQGIDEFFTAVDEKADEFRKDYRPELARKRAERAKEGDDKKEKELSKFMNDLNMDKNSQGGPMTGPRRKSKKAQEEEDHPTISDMEDDSQDAEDEDPDDYDDDNFNDDMDDGLTGRYKRALADSGGNEQEDMSFARYIKKSSMNG